MAIPSILAHHGASIALVVTENPLLLYGVPALLALLLLLIVLRLCLAHRRKKKAVVPTAVVEQEVEVIQMSMPQTSTEPAPAPAPLEQPTLPEREPVVIPDIVGGERAVVDMCPTESYDRDGKLHLYFDLQVRVD